MDITMLGTGSALVTECYNTCFIMSEGEWRLMVDGGGGNGILHQLKHANIDWRDIRHIFVTHKHLDHIMGVIWMTRMICQHMHQDDYEGEAYIYSHAEVIAIIRDFCGKIFTPHEQSFFDSRMHFVVVEDGQTLDINGKDITFFDICSTKTKQFGFTMMIGEKKLTCCGDEPYNPVNEEYVKGSDYLLHEAFCLFSEADIFDPYEKHHSTVKDACEMATKLGIKNLVLYHTEDRNLANRKDLYTAEGECYYQGALIIPNDFDVISV